MRSGWAGATALLSVVLLGPVAAGAQTTNDPFPEPIEATEDVIVVGLEEFATLPNRGDATARPMLMVHEPGTDRYFVNDMWGPIYTVSGTGSVFLYLDIADPRWGVDVNASGRERGMQSFAVHPQFAQAGTPGYGKLYTWTDSNDKGPRPDFTPGGGNDSHDTVLHEWTARTASAVQYDGGPPREVLRVEQPYGNHNGGQLAFNTLAEPGDADYGMLYVGSADGGSGGDPMNLSQNLGSIFGKMLRIDPTGSNATNGAYGIPQDNPFVGRSGALPEIYAYGIRNPQGIGWDPDTGAMYVSDIGQNIVEEVSPVTSGANLGWNVWEGSYRFVSRREVRTDGVQGDRSMTYPIAEWGQIDPLLQNQSAAGGVVVYRDDRVPQLRDVILFCDFPSGELFYVSADDVPTGGQAAIRRVLFRDGATPRTFLAHVQAKNAEQGRERASRVDLRFGTGPDGRLFLLNKHDGVIREVVR